LTLPISTHLIALQPLQRPVMQKVNIDFSALGWSHEELRDLQ
jgi:hypothetical protein